MKENPTRIGTVANCVLLVFHFHGLGIWLTFASVQACGETSVAEVSTSPQRKGGAHFTEECSPFGTLMVF